MSEAPRSSRKMPAAARVAQRAPRREWLAPEEQSDPFASPQFATPYYDPGDDDGDDAITPAVPLLTLPTIPALPAAKPAPPASPATAKRRAANHVARADTNDYGNVGNRYDTDDSYDNDDDRAAYDDTQRRRAPARRANSSGRRPAVRPEPPRGWHDDAYDDAAAATWDDSADAESWRGESTRHTARSRQRSEARPLALVRARIPNPSALLMRAPIRPAAHPAAHENEPHLIPGLRPDASVPALAAHRRMPLPHRPRVNTRAIVERARSPWSMARTLLAVLTISCALWMSVSAAGEPSQPLMALFQTRAGSFDARAITSLVQPETQGTRPDLYDSNTQFNDWWDAACSAAVMSEIMTAWGFQHATIGKLIDVMQPDISLDGGLLTPHGFQRGAEAFSYRADIDWHLTYKQLLYITNVLNLPVIINVRISYGYYHFFSGGHFLVMTGGDAQGLKIVDSSEYYIHYLPLDTFNSMFTGMTAVIVPKDYQYSVPSI